MRRTQLIALALGGALTLITPVAGCARPTAPAAVAPAASATPVGAMPFEGRAKLPKGMPIEVPAPDGRVGSTTSDDRGGGDGVWTYEMELQQSPQAVAQWYLTAYAQREWKVVGQRTEDLDGTQVQVFVLRKNGAESVVRVHATPTGSLAEVSVSLGVPLDSET